MGRYRRARAPHALLRRLDRGPNRPMAAARLPDAPHRAIAVGFVGVIGLALLPRLIDQRSSGRTDWVTASPLHTRLLHLPEEILAGPEAWRPIPLAALALAGLTTAIAAGCCSPA